MSACNCNCSTCQAHQVGACCRDFKEAVNHPTHYGGDTPYEVIKVMEEWLTPEEFIGAMKFNFFKYNARAKMKGNESQDYEKAQWYQNRLVDYMRRQREKQPNRK